MPPFPVSLYNFLSYDTYAAVLALFRVPDAWTPAAARGVTAVWAMLGATLQYLAGRALPGARRTDRSIAALLALLTWTGSVLPGAWTLAIRPDVGAVALDLAGIYVVLTVLRGRRREWLAAAGTLFFAAWAFKQSHVAVAAATTVYLLVWRRSWRDAALVAVPFAVGIALALAVGGPVYRLNIIGAPALSPLLARYAWLGVRTIALPEALFWIAFAVAAAGMLSRRRTTPRTEGLPDVELVYPLLLALTTMAAAGLMLAKAGSAINHAIELKVCAALVAAGVLGGSTARPRARDALACAAAAVMIVSHVVRLRAEWPLLADGVRGTDPTIAARRQTAARIASLPRPVYAEDELYALPWIATGNRYPAVIPDYQVYHAAKDAGRLTDTIDAMIGRRAFASLALEETSQLVPVAVESGYVRVETVTQGRDRPVALLLRPGAAGTR